MLSARLDKPDGDIHAYALLAHCFTCNKSLRAAGHITKGFMRQEGYAPNIVVGHSLGGTAVLKAAGLIESVQAVVTIASPASPSHVAEQFSDSKKKIAEDGEATVELAGRDFTIKQQFMDDLEAASIMSDIGQLKKALLVMHAPLDETVGIENAATIFQAAHHPKSYISLDQSDHLLSQPSDARYVGQLIAAWVERYLN